MDYQAHWENVYRNKEPWEVSWTQDEPKTSLAFIHSFNLSKSAAIIDIGGGDSKLVDYLISEGYNDITVLDISANAIARAKKRLGELAESINWVVCDITSFQPERNYKLWHDRATFHFLTMEEQIVKYLKVARQAVDHEGFVTMGTFSINGPNKCSGLDIRQYSEETLSAQLHNGFDKIRCITEDHITPSKIKQNFLFCSFRRI